MATDLLTSAERNTLPCEHSYSQYMEPSRSLRVLNLGLGFMTNPFWVLVTYKPSVNTGRSITITCFSYFIGAYEAPKSLN